MSYSFTNISLEAGCCTFEVQTFNIYFKINFGRLQP